MNSPNLSKFYPTGDTIPVFTDYLAQYSLDIVGSTAHENSTILDISVSQTLASIRSTL